MRRFELAQSEVRTVYSPETGRDYSIAMRLPDSFAEEPDKKYPTLYLLDGQWNFELLHRIANNLVFDEAIPEIVVVAIAPGGESPDYDALRREDFLPTRAVAFDGKTSGGDAPDFLRFIEETLIPLTERDYRADPEQRLLSGASYGGLFVLYALFEKPDLFDAYFAMSPAVTWDDRWAFKREQAFHGASKRIDADVWLSVGSQEWPKYVEANRAFFSQFQKSRYEGIRLDVRTIEGEGHAGNLPEAHTRSLRFYFEEWAKAKRAAKKE